MKWQSLAIAAALAAAAVPGAVSAQAKAPAKAPAKAEASGGEQFFPVLVYRTGPYAPNGTPFANGYVDYLKLVNAKGGINGVRIIWEECETGYATDRGVECYERLKGKHGGATVVHPLSTGITFALTEKVPVDKIPLITAGYGRSESTDGSVFAWNFPLAGTYWDAADILVQHVAKKEGGFDKLRGKKIALVYHDSPYGKEPIPLLQERAKMHGYELLLLPVAHPGVEQKSTWLQIRQQRPDYVFLWGWGVMNSTALKEAIATGYPREKMYGVWWAAAEPDVKDVGEGAKGYNGLTLQHGAAPDAKVVKEILSLVHDKGQGTGPREEVGTVLYMRGLMAAMLSVEGVKRAQERWGKGKVMTGEQVRWGLENLALDQKKLDALGFAGVLRPISTSCFDHRGEVWARIHTWDGSKWVFTSDWYQSDQQIIKPMIKNAAARYAQEKKITPRTPEDCQK
ncbi:MAG: ABC transporter substrate-binding protein [Burkholderiaceae bacterium]|nr:ABC transporter substrate-binding protein [Burkholderiaceae bacterium]